ncbi:hypothetical protein LSAT2_008185 [Lamellibrachia satsuma]|nr:hypothetical protein LSAT2_008185 [Lamellibrachia satsuma]
MLSRLFESSQYLDDVALHHLIDAMCKLSSEAMDLAYSNQEPSLFAVAKLLETGLVNLSRVDVLWKPITGHLLERRERSCGIMEWDLGVGLWSGDHGVGSQSWIVELDHAVRSWSWIVEWDRGVGMLSRIMQLDCGVGSWCGIMSWIMDEIRKWKH